VWDLAQGEGVERTATRLAYLLVAVREFGGLDAAIARLWDLAERAELVDDDEELAEAAWAEYRNTHQTVA
jgi:hypothetical protein